MKPSATGYERLNGLMVISTKLRVVKDLIGIITLVQMYQNDMKCNMKMVLGRYTAIQEGFGVKPRHM
jgi:hypothetical protein